MKKEEFTIDKFLRGLIWILLALMLIVVVHDRYVFHKLVYNKAASEVVLIEQATDSCKCRHHIDSIAKSQLVSSSAEAAITNNIRQTVNVNGNSDSLSKMIEGVSSLFGLMKDVDGLISANGLTLLISLIVAFLAALVTDKVGVIEKTSAKVDMVKEVTEKALDSNKNLQEKVQQTIETISEKTKIALESNKKLKENLQQAMIDTENKTKELYSHLANYDMLLSRIESLFNLIITIGSVVRFLSLSSVSKAENNTGLFQKVGVLCSRLSLQCDSIKDILNGKEIKIDYLSKEEKNILLTYLADSQDDLKRCREEVNSNQYLYKIIGDNRLKVEIIYNMIEAIELPKG